MNNKNNIIFLICVIAVIGIGSYIYFSHQTKSEPDGQTESESHSQTEPESKKYDFATFTTDAAMNFIREENIQMPEGFETIEGHEEQVLQIILFAYQNPDMCMGFSRKEMMDFSLEISEKVHAYME